MPLPDLIEMVPLDGPVRAEITVPGSKSITNRALVLAALAAGETTLRGALWSEDTQVMAEALQRLGFSVQVEPDREEICNRTITVQGLDGRIPRAGTANKPLELFVANAGTAARFLTALLCLGRGVYGLSGAPRMHERPQEALFQALRELGYHIDSPDNKLPALIHGAGPRPGKCRVSIEKSSQFASALMLCAKHGGWDVAVSGENAEESPYVRMSSELIAVFPKTGGTFQIEPDTSSGSYFLAAGHWELIGREASHSEDGLVHTVTKKHCSLVTVKHWPTSGWQMDELFWPRFGELARLSVGFGTEEESKWVELVGANWRERLGEVWPEGYSPFELSRQNDLGDSIMTAIVMSPFAMQPVKFTDLGRLRLQECERVAALRTELSKCGAKVVETGDTLEVFPSRLHGAEIETYNDHRMAMCFAILGLKVPGIKIKNPACVKKTFPNFFQKLAAAPPRGLGATILHAPTGRRLEDTDLFADY